MAQRGLWRHGAVASGARSHRVWVALLLLTALLPGQWDATLPRDSKEDAPAQNGERRAPRRRQMMSSMASAACVVAQASGCRVPSAWHRDARRDAPHASRGFGPYRAGQEFTYQTRQGHLPLANIIATYGPAEETASCSARIGTRARCRSRPEPAHRNRPIRRERWRLRRCRPDGALAPLPCHRRPWACDRAL